MISQQYFTTTKILYQFGGKQPPAYLDYLGAITLWNDFHSINGVKENFKQIHTETVPFSTNMFENLLNNNYVKDQFGNDLEILTFDWVNETKKAEIMYGLESGEGQNTKTIVING